MHPRSNSDESEFERSRGVPPGAEVVAEEEEEEEGGGRQAGRQAGGEREREVDARVYFLVCRFPVSTG